MNLSSSTKKEEALRAAEQCLANAAQLRWTAGKGNDEKAVQLEEKARELRIKAASL